jgi:hypothetical protein
MDNQKPQIKYETQEDRKGRTRGNDDQCVFFVFSGFLSSILTLLSVLLPKKKDGPEGISPLGAVKPGDVLLSHNL